MWPSISIWIKPELTFEKLKDLPHEVIKQKTNLIFLVISISQALFNLTIKDTPISLALFGEVLLQVALLFISVKYIFPYLLLILSQIFKGQADINLMRTLFAYASLPFLFIGLMAIAYMADLYLIKGVELINMNITVTYWVIALLSLRFYVYGLSLYNKISYLYALLIILIYYGLFEVLSSLLLHLR